MSWLAETTTRWLAVLAAAGPAAQPPDEAVRLISEAGVAAAAPAADAAGRKRRHRHAVPVAVAVTALSRHLVTSMLAADVLVTRLSAATGRTREEILADVSGAVPQRVSEQQVHALGTELTADITALVAAGWPPYTALGDRVGQLLRAAQAEGDAIIERARAQAAGVTGPQ